MSLGLTTSIIVILLIFAASFRGFVIGFIGQIFSSIGLFLGIILGILISGLFLPSLKTNNLKIFVLFVITSIITSLCLVAGEMLGAKLKEKVKTRIANEIDCFLGSILAALSAVILIWIVSSILSIASLGRLSTVMYESPIVRSIDKIMPNIPNFMSNIEKYFTKTGFPKVFSGIEPTPVDNNAKIPSVEIFNNAISKDKYSIVKLTSTGCGGLIEGSGFVVGNNIVITNAHVIAGANQTIITDINGNHSTQLIYFDPNLDFAMLRVENLGGKPLILSSKSPNNLDKVAFLGFPGNQNLSAQSALLLDSINATGNNIYNKNNITRKIYEIKGDVMLGDSGGPLIDQQGNVIGMMFAKSIDFNDIGYALTNNELKKDIANALSGSIQSNNSKCIK